MFRGRKRKLPSFFRPEPFYHGDSDSDSDNEPRNVRRRRVLPHQLQDHEFRDDADDNVGPEVASDNDYNVAIEEESGEDDVQSMVSVPLFDDMDDDDREVQPALAPVVGPIVNLTEQVDEEEEEQDQEQEEEEDEEEEQEQEQQQEQEEDKQEAEAAQTAMSEDDVQDEPQHNMEVENMDDLYIEINDGEDHDSNDENANDPESYTSLLHSMAKQWITTKLEHTISKVGSNKL